jgi:hypothetical protein
VCQYLHLFSLQNRIAHCEGYIQGLYSTLVQEESKGHQVFHPFIADHQKALIGKPISLQYSFENQTHSTVDIQGSM